MKEPYHRTRSSCHSCPTYGQVSLGMRLELGIEAYQKLQLGVVSGSKGSEGVTSRLEPAAAMAPARASVAEIEYFMVMAGGRWVEL